MVQDEIFRFMNLRPVQKARIPRISKNFASFGMKTKPVLQDSIEKLSGDDAYARSLDLARAQLAVPCPDNKGIYLPEITLKASAASNVIKAKEVIRSETGMEAEVLLKDPAMSALYEWYWNSLLAHSLLPGEAPEQREEIFEGVRAFHFMHYLLQQAAGDRPIDSITLKSVRPVIPRAIFFNPPMPDKEEEPEGWQPISTQWEAVKDKIGKLSKAIDEISNGDRIMRARQLPAIQRRTETSKARPGKPGTPASPRLRTRVAMHRTETAAKLIEAEKAAIEKADTSMLEATFTIREKMPAWIYAEEAKKYLSDGVRSLLGEMKDNTEEMSVGALSGKLSANRYKLASDFVKSLPETMIGHVDKLEGFRTTIAALAIPDLKFKIPYPKVMPDKTSPLGRGIRPLGIGDLLVVKQKLVKYEAGEVAHVENVLKSEFKTRTHTRMNQVESVEEVLEESSQSSEKDTQSTERFELRAEAEHTIEEQMQIDAGVSVTAGFGPVSLSTHADFAISSSERDSERTASAYAKDITGRAVTRVAERVRQQRRTRNLQRIEERNEHGFDNKEGAGHVIGLYRWLDKYYKARLINYGKRLMLEFIIPEPAAFYLRNQENREVASVDVKKPREPKINGKLLNPKELHKENYMDFVAEYNVYDIEPYPEDYITVSQSFGEAAGVLGNVDFAKTYDTWVIPEGYEVESVYGGATAYGYPPNHVSFSLAGVEIGGSIAGLEGIIPVSVSGFISAFQMNMVAICRPTEKSVARWRLKAFQAIMKAYHAQLSAYQEALAAAEIQAGVKIEGRNPGINRKIEADELRKGVLRILTNNFAKIKLEGKWRHNEEFRAMKDNDGNYGYPAFNIAEALIDGKIIQFFEQAMDWPNMTYFFYPYFWARKKKWEELFPMSDPDPMFAQFLRSGAARVVVPVQPEYTEVVLHYMATNELWNGGYPPTINDELYISIVDEMRAENGMSTDDELPACSVDSGYPCVVDEWEVKLPTDLVYLQPDDSLPDFGGQS